MKQVRRAVRYVRMMTATRLSTCPSMSEGGITNPTYVEHEETEMKEIKKRQAGEGKKG